ncbi:MAG: glycogen synthase GlgA [Candidatus Hodarchaeales archaeon]|jgi:starch synthase
MYIAMFASEMEPYVKTGGLADVIGSLPKALAANMDHIDVFIPLYREIARSGYSLKQIDFEKKIRIGTKYFTGRIHQIKQKDHSIYLIDNYKLFRNRSQLYVKNGKDYHDNLERFVFFCKYALSVCGEHIPYDYDVYHCHDWQTALIPVYVKLSEHYKSKPPLCVYTIHNLAYQGQFAQRKFPILGIPNEYCSEEYLLAWGKINLMKGGILFADELTTVSPTYAQEIQTNKYGVGFHKILANRRDYLKGILNGVDYTIWNPSNNPRIPREYSSKNLSGKSECKEFIQRFFNLPVNSNILLCGVVSRLAWQKGMDLLSQILPEILPKHELQFILLGNGEKKLEEKFKSLERKFPNQIGVKIGFGHDLAHQIEAGSDVFLMPSRYEPCGLNDKYSMKFGTVPIVHATGGLEDSIIDYDHNPEAGTGFKFTEFKPEAFIRAILSALKLFQSKPKWIKLMRNGMRQDFSWAKSAEKYLEIYRRSKI